MAANIYESLLTLNYKKKIHIKIYYFTGVKRLNLNYDLVANLAYFFYFLATLTCNILYTLKI